MEKNFLMMLLKVYFMDSSKTLEKIFWDNQFTHNSGFKILKKYKDKKN